MEEEPPGAETCRSNANGARRSEQPRFDRLPFANLGFLGQGDGHARSCLIEGRLDGLAGGGYLDALDSTAFGHLEGQRLEAELAPLDLDPLVLAFLLPRLGETSPA